MLKIPPKETGLESDLSDVYNAWKGDPNPDNSANVLKALRPSIDQGIRLFTGQVKPSPNMRSRARQTALQALGTYRPDRGSLRTHVVGAMQGMRRINRNEQNPITIPDRMYLDNVRINNAVSELEFQLGREPTDVEIADRVGISRKRIGKIRAGVKPAMPTSYFENMGDEGGGGFQPAVVAKSDDSLLHAAVYDELDPVGQKIFEWTLGYNGNERLPNNQIARRLGITPSAVTQRKERIQRRLEELMQYSR